MASLLLYILTMAVSFVTFNVNGCANATKRSEIIQYLKTFESDIIFLSETHSTPLDENEWSFNWGGPCFFSHGTSSSGGLAILFSNKVNIDNVDLQQLVPGRCLYLNLTTNKNNLHLVNIHSPTSGEDRLYFLKQLDGLLSKVNKDELMIVGGDFNSTLYPEKDRKSKKETHKPSSDALYKIVRKYSLVDVWREFYPDKIEYTWCRTIDDQRSSAARLDRFYISGSYHQLARSAQILPPFRSDHSPLKISLQLSPTSKKAGHWCLNQSILNEQQYIDEITHFWTQWNLNRTNFQSLNLWWDVGKSHIKTITKEYCSSRSKIQRSMQKQIEAEILYLENQNNKSDSSQSSLNELKQQLHEIQLNQVKGACIRNRFDFAHHLNSPTKFFFNLEYKRGCSRTIPHLEDDNGTIQKEPTKIAEIAKSFYMNLYTKSPTDQQAQNKLLKNIPTLSDSSKDILEQDLTFEEFTRAIKESPSNKSPGIDGLPFEFYRKFWNLMGQDLFDVFNYSVQNNVLPKSCTRSVITLLPKTGNLGLIKNWRPVSLLCTDYKLLTKVLSNRLRNSLDEVIHPDQTYTVPNRTIYHNLSLLRDSINIANLNNVPLGIVSLDQEKAFDRVDHDWLFKTLSAMGYGPNFISYVKLIYQDPECLLKINGDLTNSFKFGRGIRQGCPLSGSLFAVCIEPLLHYIRESPKIKGFSADQTNYNKLSGYADDINFFVTRNSEFNFLAHAVKLYELASSAKVNAIKSKGLWCGSWKHRTDSPLNFTWVNNGLKFLGVHLGNDAIFEMQNWNGLYDVIKSRLGKWKTIFPYLSLRGRVLIINFLGASKLWHKMHILSPPRSLQNDIQRLFISILWLDKRHWVSKELLTLHPHDGGLGLVDIGAKVASFRIGFLKQMLYSDVFHPSFAMCAYIFRQHLSLNYDQQWLTSNIPREHWPSSAKVFQYMRDCIYAQACQTVLTNTDDTTVETVLNEAIFFNSSFHFDYPISNSLLYLARITKIGDLFNCDGSSKSLEDIHELIPHRSVRLLSKEVNGLIECLPTAWKDLLNEADLTSISSSYSCKKVFILDRFDDESFYELATFPNKDIYYHICRSYYADENENFPGYKWKDILLSERYPTFSAFYVFPIPKEHGDIQWRISHGAIANQLFRYNAGFSLTPNCLFCSELDDLKHTFIECPNNDEICTLVINLLGKIDPQYILTLEDYILLSKKRSRNTKQMNLIFVLAKSAIYKSLSNKSYGCGCTSPVVIFTSKLKSIIQTEFEFYRLTNNIERFLLFWCCNEAFCAIENEELIFYF